MCPIDFGVNQIQSSLHMEQIGSICICKIGNKTKKMQVLSMSVYLYFIHYLLNNPNLIPHYFELNLLLMICEPKLTELKK